MSNTASRAHAGLACLSAALFSLYPLSVLIRANAGFVPVDVISLSRIVAGCLAATAALIWILRFVDRDLTTRAVWASVSMLLIGYYDSLTALALRVTLHARYDGPYYAAAYVGAALVLPPLLLRPRHTLEPSHSRPLEPSNPLPAALTLAAGVVLSANLGAAILHGPLSPAPMAGPVAPDVAALVAATLGARARPARDVYYLVFDGFGRPDVLRELYGVDLEPLVAGLRSKGFVVPDRGRANYAQTYPALASSLNLGYVDGAAAAVGPDATDRRILASLIDDNALMALAKRAGYEVVVIGSDYLATRRIGAADVCVCRRLESSDFEHEFLGLTPLAATRLPWWIDDQHRRHVMEAFTAIEGAAADRPRFVFAHIVSPHPPVVFDADGRAHHIDRPLGGLFNDGSHYRGSRADYVDGYRRQVQYLSGRLAALVDTLLQPGRPVPAIVVHGDHGPGSMLHWYDASRSNLDERFGIFSAYLLPDGSQPWPTITPVNGLRLLSNATLGTHLDALPDQSWF
jgi:hypothetical protein